MGEEIILDRGDTAAMKLSEGEQALMHEIELEAPARSPARPSDAAHVFVQGSCATTT